MGFFSYHSLCLALLFSCAFASEMNIFGRIVIRGHDKVGGASSLADILDLGHSRMIASNIFTAAEVAQMDIDSINYFGTTFGLSFSNCSLLGVFGIPGTYQCWYDNGSLVGAILPFANGDTEFDYILGDTYDQGRASKSNPWRAMDFANIAYYFSTNPTDIVITSGASVGVTFKPGQFAIFARNVIFKMGGDLSNPNNIEHSYYKAIDPATSYDSPWVGLGIGQNQAGAVKYFSGVDFACEGEMSLSVITTKEADGTIIKRSRQVITYPKNGAGC